MYTLTWKDRSLPFEKIVQSDVKNAEKQPFGTPYVLFQTQKTPIDTDVFFETKGRNARNKMCSIKDVSCLDEVKKDQKNYNNFVKVNKDLLNRSLSLSQFEQFKNPFPLTSRFPIPQYQPLNWLATKSLVSFTQGQKDQAFQESCAAIQLGRALMTNGSYLIDNMVGASLVQTNAKVFVEMLSANPNQSLPSDCQKVFATPINVPHAVCSSLTNEKNLMRSSLDEIQDFYNQQRFVFKALNRFNKEKTLNEEAKRFDWFCGVPVQKDILSQTPIAGFPQQSYSKHQCVDNSLGCKFLKMASPRYENYAIRIQNASRVFGVAKFAFEKNQTGNFSLAGIPHAVVEKNNVVLDLLPTQPHPEKEKLRWVFNF